MFACFSMFSSKHRSNALIHKDVDIFKREFCFLPKLPKDSSGTVKFVCCCIELLQVQEISGPIQTQQESHFSNFG
ncbi:hypothetical protein AS149_13490 [Burkholderia cenocepacia]|nr:hypothetical protein AS149_13490 [Burkholderia cenocepacia]